MADRFRLVVNRANVVGLLKSDGVADLVRRKAKAAESAAKSSSSAGGDFRYDEEMGAHRFRAAVIGDYDATDPAVSRKALLAGLDAAQAEE